MPLVKSSCLCWCPHGNRPGKISSSNLRGWSFLRLLSLGRCERKTTTLWSAALRIPRPHIYVAFSLWTDWWWKRGSFAFRLSGLFVTSETYVTDLARISRLKLKQTKFGMIGMHFFLRKHTYFHGSYILLRSCFALDFHNWVDFQRSVANKNCLYKPFKFNLLLNRV